MKGIRQFILSRQLAKRLRQEERGGAGTDKEDRAMREAADGLTFVMRTDIGMVRAVNQDALVQDGLLFGVADGMGGHKGGEVASAEARDAVQGAVRGRTPAEEALRAAVNQANERVYTMSAADEHLAGMGTTLTLLWAGPAEMLIANVGDSRCYLLRGGQLRQVTQDHSWVAEMVRMGLLTEYEAAHSDMRNIITRAVGLDPEVETDIVTEQRCPGDRWLICTDGLYGMMEAEELLGALQEESLEKCADQLMAAAIAGGGYDNISFVVVDDRRKDA